MLKLIPLLLVLFLNISNAKTLFRYPLEGNPKDYEKVTRYFGNQISGKYLDWNCGHLIGNLQFPDIGTDFGVGGKIGKTKVVAAATGTIYKVVDGFDDSCYQNGQTDPSCVGDGFGNHVWIKHSDGIQSIYAHLQKGSVNKLKVGEEVGCGTYLGKVGNSGRSKGAHLHFEVRDSNSKKIDPYKGQCGNKVSYWVDQGEYRTDGRSIPSNQCSPDTSSDTTPKFIKLWESNNEIKSFKINLSSKKDEYIFILSKDKKLNLLNLANGNTLVSFPKKYNYSLKRAKVFDDILYIRISEENSLGEYILSYDLSNKKELWKIPVQNQKSYRIDIINYEDKILLNGRSGYSFLVSKSTGEVLKKLELPSSTMAISPPDKNGDSYLVTRTRHYSEDGRQITGTTGRLFLFNILNNQPELVFKKGRDHRLGFYETPLIYKDNLILAGVSKYGGSQIFSLNKKFGYGDYPYKETWKYPAYDQGYDFSFQEIYEDKIILIDTNRYFYSFDITSGKPSLGFEIKGSLSRGFQLINNELRYFSGKNKLTSIDVRTGEVNWDKVFSGIKVSSIALSKNGKYIVLKSNDFMKIYKINSQ